MTGAGGNLLRKALIVLGVAVSWAVLFHLNAVLFAHLEHSNRAHWIFLPAAVRVLSVLLFQGAGAGGLMLGAFFTLPHHGLASLATDLLISASSAIAPLVSVVICRRWIGIAADLSGLRGLHIVAVSVLSAATNAVGLNIALAAAGQLRGDMEQVATVFVGDMLGSAIVLAVISLGLSAFTRRAAGRA